MPDLEPITRDEMLWSGEDVEPITRREMYIRHLYDETQVIPDRPITREEMFILKAGEELHDVTIEQLNVSENGTYSESGKAYSPVIVNVPAPPLPQNAYLLKEVEGLPSSIATFTDGADDMPMKSLVAEIEPVQDLHGYDAPWVGGGGKNKAKPYSYTVTSPNGVTFTYNGDGSVTLNGTATASQAVPSVSVAVQNDLTFTLGSGTWIPSVSANNVTYEVYDTATSTLLSNGASFTLTEAKTVLFRVGAVNGQTYNNLKVYMQIESGQTATTFAPYSNICPISGWTEAEVSVSGINIWDEEWEAGGYDVTTGEKIAASGKIRSKNFIPVAPNTNYYVSTGTYDLSSYGLVKCGYDADKNYIGRLGSNYQRLFTTPADCYYITFSPNEYYGDTYNNDISINYPSTDTEYHAYNGHTTTIPFLDSQGNPITVYGGECDVVNGGEQPSTYLKWTLTPTVSQIASVGINDCLISIPDNKMPIDWNVNVNNCMCDKLKVSNYSAQHDNHVHFPNSTIIALYLEDEVGTTKQEWVDYLAQAQITVCYKVATPATFTSQPTSIKSLEGVNNVWGDCGQILEGEYFSKEA